jgi:hypothetical protein
VIKVFVGAAAAVLLLLPARVGAQENSCDSPKTVQDILACLHTNERVPTGDVEADRAAADATRNTVTRALLSAIATLPVSTSSSGFTYRLNPALGTVERASETFGPFFVERALTSGSGQASFGFTFQFASFRSLDGNDLTDGEFVTLARQFRDEPAPFEIQTLALDVSTRTATLFGNVGLSDRVDLGVALPIVQLDVNGTRNHTYRGSTTPRLATAKTRGLADIAVRSKVRLTGDGPGAVAAGFEVRLPTGQEDNLLGAGEMALRFHGLASAEAGRTSFHGNFVVGTGGIGREISYGGAVTVAATPQFTIVGELLGRRIAGVQRITELVAPQPDVAHLAFGSCPRNCINTMRLIPDGEDQTSAIAVTGFKWNVGGTWLLHGHVLWPVTDAGLTARFTPTIALDYSFTR